MLRSMTGFGKGEAEAGGISHVVQIKSVNNRFLEIALKLPPALWPYEAEAKAMLQKALSRGKLDLHWKESRPAGAAGAVSANLELAWAYKKALETLAQGLALPVDIRLEQLARYPEVISASDGEGADAAAQAAARWEGFKAALAAALKDMEASRGREGKALETEMRGLLGNASSLADGIEARSAELAPLFADKLKKKLAQLLEKAPDDSRLLQEAAILSERADIREETVRFRAHVAEFTRLLDEGGAVGKRLDFLSQELLREANTMGSKSPDAGLTQKVVLLKGEIEKLKEQIQNLE